jgi:hypothetical protein
MRKKFASPKLWNFLEIKNFGDRSCVVENGSRVCATASPAQQTTNRPQVQRRFGG